MASVSPRAGTSGFGPKLRSRKHGAAAPLDDLDKRLLNLMQGRFPIAQRPYQHVAAEAGIDEQEAIARVQRLQNERIIRQVTPIFDTRALGYSSMLVAAKVDAENPWRAASIINEHPGVSHNYRRNHDFNLWWTIAVPPSSSLEDHVQRVHELAGGESTRLMHTIRMFKIGVDLDMTGKRAPDAKSTLPAYKASPVAGVPLDEGEIASLRELQEDIALEPSPYASMARRIGVTEGELIDRAHRFVGQGRARRFAAVLYHRHAGFTANAMSVWKVPEDRIDEVGMTMAGFAAISHCYQRPTYPDWPYNLFGMLHGRSKPECEAAAEAIASETKIDQRAMLYSTKEYKKVRVRYYTEDFFEWERSHLNGGSA
jgi:DNA-binding Lrp family transcriptional regulator